MPASGTLGPGQFFYSLFARISSSLVQTAPKEYKRHLTLLLLDLRGHGRFKDLLKRVYQVKPIR